MPTVVRITVFTVVGHGGAGSPGDRDTPFFVGIHDTMLNRYTGLFATLTLSLGATAQDPADRDTGFEMIVPPPLVSGAGTSQYTNMLLEDDGTVMFAGGIYNYAGDYGGVLRMDPTGSFSNTWTGNFFGTVRAMAKSPDGKYYMAGQFTSYAGVDRVAIVRIDADGSLDESFDAGPDAPPIQVFSVAVQPDGKVLVGGNFADWAGSGRKGLVRLNTDGSVDESFSVGTGTNGNSQVLGIKVLDSGKILIGGTFSNFNGSQRALARLNADGSVDDTFSHAIPSGSIQGFKVMADGRIVTAGQLWRFMPDGATDPSFQGQGALTNVLSVEPYPDGRILAGGIFSSAAGQPAQRFVRLNADGTHDGTFDTSTGFDGNVLGIQLDAQGRIYVCHYGSTYKGEELLHYHSQFSINNKFVIRLHGDGLPASIRENEVLETLVYPNPGKDLITVRMLGHRIEALQLFSVDGRSVKSMAGGLMDQVTLSLDGILPGTYLVELRTAGGQRVVKQMVKE